MYYATGLIGYKHSELSKEKMSNRLKIKSSLVW